MKPAIKKILLTGGNGLLGKTLSPMLKETYEVTHFELVDPQDGLPFIEGNLCDADACQEASKGMDAIIHTAALHGAAWAKAGDKIGFEVNTVGTANILEAAVKNGVKRVVFTSSIWATGHNPTKAPYLPIDEDLPREPNELYGLTKILGETTCSFYSANNGISTIALRAGGITPAECDGVNDPRFLSCVVNVKDLADAHILALEADESLIHDVFIITTDSPLCQVKAEDFFNDPIQTLDQVVPGTKQMVEEDKFNLDNIIEWHTVEKAKNILGYEPKFKFSIK